MSRNSGQNSTMPHSIRLRIPPGADMVLFRDYDREWEKLGLKISVRVKVLAASCQNEHLWQFGRLCDICAPVKARGMVLSNVDVDHYHARLNALVQYAFTGGCASGSWPTSKIHG